MKTRDILNQWLRLVPAAQQAQLMEAALLHYVGGMLDAGLVNLAGFQNFLDKLRSPNPKERQKPLVPDHTFFAYQIYDDQAGVNLGVELDAGDLLKRLAAELNGMYRGSAGIETFEVGQVDAPNVEAALDAVRAAAWVNGSLGSADGATRTDL